jgi:hypothetical protein
MHNGKYLPSFFPHEVHRALDISRFGMSHLVFPHLDFSHYPILPFAQASYTGDVSKQNGRAGPEDANELAFRVVQQLTGQAERTEPEESAKARAGRLGGLKGGKARYNALTPERRSEIARNASAARWAKIHPNQA